MSLLQLSSVTSSEQIPMNAKLVCVYASGTDRANCWNAAVLVFRNLKAKQFEDTGYTENMKNQFKGFALTVPLPIGERALVFGDGVRSLLKKSFNQTFDVLGHTASQLSLGYCADLYFFFQETISEEIFETAFLFHHRKSNETAQWHLCWAPPTRPEEATSFVASTAGTRLINSSHWKQAVGDFQPAVLAPRLHIRSWVTVQRPSAPHVVCWSNSGA